MSTTRRPQLRRVARRRRNGQSIPIIALMILVLVAMVGLSVDVGNTFSHERQAVSAGNAAAVSAMTTYLKRGTNAVTDGDVYKSIKDTLTNNGMTVSVDGANDTVQVAAYYLNAQGEVLSDRPKILEGSGQTVPNNVAYIQVKLNGKVDTSFARVVGRNDLPINASAHAGLCPVNSGVYPLAVDSATITGDRFNSTGTTGATPEYKTLTSGNYRGYIQRRIYVKDGNTAGSFSWLRWMDPTGATGTNAVSAQELAASLTGAGNISSGFQEAPWPSGVSSAPAGYPLDPGNLSVGDWVWGSPGWKENNAAKQASVSAALDEHILNETKMILPIYSNIMGTGSNVQARVVRLGAFVITGQGMSPGDGPYFDMVFLGDPVRQYTACTVTAPPPTNSNLELFGNVSFYPEYQVVPSTQNPIQYIVVLDTSGSMSANFNGQCNNSGGLKQCANGPPGAPAVQVTNTGVQYWWSTESERRIYVAKKALQRLVSLTNMSGNAGFDTTRPPDQMGVVWFTDNVPASPNTKSFSSDPVSLASFITTANNGNGDYRSQGGTNGAAALYRASLMYGSAPKTVTYSSKSWDYKRVVLFITDGVSNQFLDTTKSNLSGGQSDSSRYPTVPYCANLGTLVVESAQCQTTDVGGKWNGWDRPITQMINTSSQYLRNTTVNASVFVIALSSIPSTGLNSGVSSSSNYFFSAESLITYANGKTNVDVIIDTIKDKAQNGDCVPGPSGSSTGSVLTDQFVNGTGGFTYPQVGEVVIYNSTNTMTAPIIADQASGGALTYHFLAVPQGTYRMSAHLYYHHPLDPPSVMREYSKIWTAGQSLDSFTVDVSPSTQSTSFLQRIEQPLILKLNGNVCPVI
ncbi:MAG: Tad domain-containing protein [Chloroflexales bacterium]